MALPADAVWFITGCSSGIGKSLSTLIASHPSYRLVASARKVESLSYLPDSPRVTKVALDVTKQADIENAIQHAVSTFGRIDVLINNAGFAIMGEAEAFSDEDMRVQLETMFFGPVKLTIEAVKVMRDKNPENGGKMGGVIVNITSMGGRVAVQGHAFYHSAKFALEGFTEGISKEVLPSWNIKFLLFEPGGVKTNYAGDSMVHLPHPPAYDPSTSNIDQLRAYMTTKEASAGWADPDDVSKLLVNTVSGGEFPLRFLVGSDAYGFVKGAMENELETMKKWESVSVSKSSKEQLESINFLKK